MQSSDKLEKLLSYFNTTKNKLGVEINKRQSLYDIANGKIKSFSPDLVSSILKVFPNVNGDWLLYDKGEMLKPSNYIQKEQEPIIINEKTNISQVSNDGYMMVEYAELSAVAGQLGFENPATLPKNKTRLVPKEYENGNYLVIKVEGDSMDCLIF